MYKERAYSVKNYKSSYCEIWGFHGAEDLIGNFLGCDAMLHAYIYKVKWRWRQQDLRNVGFLTQLYISSQPRKPRLDVNV